MDKDYERFIRALTAEVEKQLGKDYTAVRQDIVKNNGVMCRYITISKRGYAMSPCIRTDPYYELYRGLEDLRVIAADIVKVYHGSGFGTETADMSRFRDWEQMRGYIMFRLVNTERNAEALESMPHLDLPELGLSMTCYIAWKEEPAAAAAVSVKKNLMRLWGVTEDDILEQARRNTPEQKRVFMRSMPEVLYSAFGSGEEQYPEAFEQVPMYVLTNEQQTYGAACMLYEGVLEQAAEKFGSDLYILPSSVHEVILLPVPGKLRGSVEDMRNMVREVNASDDLPEEEVLSDEVFYYDREKRELLIAE